jgi:HAD superfamily hydrolase (TIGR01549 family)
MPINPHDALEKARSMIEKDGGSNETLRISNVAAALARDHNVVRDDEIRTRFFQLLDARMDKTGPDQSLVKLLKEFACEGFHLGMVTFVRKQRITRRLDVWKLKQYFESVITPDDESDFKPSPQPFIRAMVQLQVQAADCFVIGDEPVDMIGGKKAGARTVGLPQGFFSREELERAGADYIISSLNQLPSIVTI